MKKTIIKLPQYALHKRLLVGALQSRSVNNNYPTWSGVQIWAFILGSWR